jgi:serine/threonine protein kinase
MQALPAADSLLQTVPSLTWHARALQGVLFRDLKPENVLLVDGVAKLADFGAAIDMRSERPMSRLVSPCPCLLRTCA